MGGRVAFLGPEGTFTSEAVRRAAPDLEGWPLATIDEVVDAVRGGEADLGVVPIENSIEGSVNLTLDALAFGEPGVYIRGELLMPVSMNLLARLIEKDVKALTTDRNVPEVLRLAARKRLAPSK